MTLKVLRPVQSLVARNAESDQQVPDRRLSLACLPAQRLALKRHRTPAHKEETMTAQHLLRNRHGAGALRLVPRREEDPNCDFPFGVKPGVQPLRFAREKCRGQLHGNARAVAAGAVRVNRAAVREASKAFEGLLNDSMRRRLTQLGDKAYTAGVVLFLPIESCPWGALQFGTTSLILKGLSCEAGAQRTPLPHALYSAYGW